MVGRIAFRLQNACALYKNCEYSLWDSSFSGLWTVNIEQLPAGNQLRLSLCEATSLATVRIIRLFCGTELLLTISHISISNMLLANSDPSISRQQVAMGFLRFELETFSKSPDKVGPFFFIFYCITKSPLRHQLTAAGLVRSPNALQDPRAGPKTSEPGGSASRRYEHAATSAAHAVAATANRCPNESTDGTRRWSWSAGIPAPSKPYAGFATTPASSSDGP